MSKQLTGIAASSGIAIAKAFRAETPDLTVTKESITNPDEQIKTLEQALDQSMNELEAIREKTLKDLGEEHAEIFSAHLLVLKDPELVDPIKQKIQDDHVNASFALKEVTDQFVTMFESMDNEYMKERAADIRDVSKRVLAHVLGEPIASLAEVDEEVIIVADDLTPSDTAQLNKKYVQGFVTDIGGRTSHSAIMARSMEIPAVVGTKEVTSEVEAGTMMIIDGLSGEVVIDPSEDELKQYRQKQADFEEQKKEWAKLKNEPSKTKDGVQVELVANIGTPDDVEGVENNGSEGVGLYRTEFLYMGREDLPSEDEQFEAYKKVVEQMGERPVVIRTLDVGGDKELPYLNLPDEMNPFLGFRAIRLCLEKDDIFRTQLRALLRASVYGNLKIMFPMIATLDEFRQAKQMLEEEKNQLQAEQVNVGEEIEVGIMVEIPSTAVMAPQFAKEVDFFSIGTNDLIQYTMAADRMNEQVSYLYQPYNPAILRLVKMVIDASHAEGKWTGMCGEMAGDEVAVPLLLGLGLDEFSMSATSVLPARSQLSKLTKAEAVKTAEKALEMNSADEVEALVREQYL
ncbi:phosphoenolpyruvate--protein phosphotransferase [Salisediminibacterium halotolerans]|uniref:Phosphoenolpyruvate-protein phosphotransferase n=1 Tax=Salisediminibacterium halotolerans TaxID=517425 RepID=A0A1H9U1V8_9BACI|nr:MULTISPECIES: phosphoenolpyruvate--protein phosphotransferase [Salisediminibacterium]RLJ81114.1 phosphoenolpyruvate--protein phosphotransferase [Actinophytocola xinjiangensis]RPE84077.1 phosphoenolpyruvate--protein phosphotransferase [Salisediminibacterium halotolerans]TWG38541.1 phosphoenolpyruvate--protein phosphotransferase [Salisediminibacterium halotolerans]SES03580.1 phosphotransferase system, enzyme I, PtsI [Salisediminibacterium haloalkalitolerans]GEL07183.1 phosphoenolpyruvate-prot